MNDQPKRRRVIAVEIGGVLYPARTPRQLCEAYEQYMKDHPGETTLSQLLPQVISQSDDGELGYQPLKGWISPIDGTPHDFE